MSRSRRDEPTAGTERSAAERERARLEREARRAGKPPPAATSAAPPPAPPPPAPPPPAPAPSAKPPPEPEHADRIPLRHPARTPNPAPGRQARAGRDERIPIRRIQPNPPAPPAAPAGALDDETERPIGIRRARRPVRPIVTPPGDTPAGPARRRRISPARRIVALLMLAVLAVIIIGALMLFQPFGSAEGAQVQVTIPPGSGAGEIGEQLAQAGVVESAFFFRVRATLSGKRDRLRSGEHTLQKDMTYSSAIEALSTPETTKTSPTVSITIPEGRTRREIAPIAKKAGLRGSYMEASSRFGRALSPSDYGVPKGTRSLEGFLFPATYELNVGAPARDLVERQLKAFRENISGVNMERARRKNLTRYEVLIIASMVEREAQLAKERPLIAAVIYNRLSDGTPLGIDATTRYALNKPSGALRQSELEMDSPYNTRKRAGLPPTPIGNPGLASIRAAAAPADVEYRYFVVKPGTCGEHVFAATIEEHNRNVARYAGARAKAGDKSPTTC
ncbi:MAG: endolytic transglycosylase MltG [Actinobacteria bacterium]|nr:endolytic transglycosylase MltG [Actinomycetota bacterium]